MRTIAVIRADVEDERATVTVRLRGERVDLVSYPEDGAWFGLVPRDEDFALVQAPMRDLGGGFDVDDLSRVDDGPWSVEDLLRLLGVYGELRERRMGL